MTAKRAARRGAEILAIGMVTPVGLSAHQTAASVRTGIARLAESYVTDRFGEPLVMGLVDDRELPPLAEELEERGQPTDFSHFSASGFSAGGFSAGGFSESRLSESGFSGSGFSGSGSADPAPSPRQQRLARLGAPALLEALGSGPREAIPLLLALPEPRAEARYPIGSEMIELLSAQAGRRFDGARSRAFLLGRAGGLVALDEALRLLDRHEAPSVLVGAIDSYLDLGLLEALDDEGRLKTGEIADGFVPGEGAAFLWLAPAGAGERWGRPPVARVAAVGRAQEAGHLYSAEPNRGDGLAASFKDLFDNGGAGPGAPGGEVGGGVDCVYAGLNGESFWAKEWGVAQIRCAAHLRQPLRVLHPADCFGDAGAALGLILLGLGALDLSRKRISGPCLVWGGADRGERAAALLSR